MEEICEKAAQMRCRSPDTRHRPPREVQRLAWARDKARAIVAIEHLSTLTVSCVTINARDPRALAEFWAGLVGGTPRDSDKDFVLLDPGEGRIPMLLDIVSARLRLCTM